MFIIRNIYTYLEIYLQYRKYRYIFAEDYKKMIKHFNIIQALCRSALITPNSAIIQQVERLIKALRGDGSETEANSLDGLLKASKDSMAMAPSRIDRSFAMTNKEALTPKTIIPVDKETSTPLAEIYFPDELPLDMPMFDEDIREAIMSVINEWNNFGQLAKIGAYPASSCLIYGKPGTGKTHLAKWISRQIGVPVILARLEGLMSSFLGTTSKNIGNLFSFADRYNCVLLLDEFDAIAKLRNDPQEVGEVKRVVNTLLQCLDIRKNKGFTIGVTNHELLLDPAIWRRFDIQIEVPSPSLEVVIMLMRKFLMPLEFNETELKFFSWIMTDTSGADIEMFSKWIKRSTVIYKGAPIISVVKRFALLNSGRICEEKRMKLSGTDEELIISLSNDNNYTFKQIDIANLLGVSASNISKIVTKHK